MRVGEIKSLVEVVTAVSTTFALIIGGGFGAYQYLEKAHDDRVKETLNFLDRYTREPVAGARSRQQEKWLAYLKEERTTAGKDYDAFLKRVIAAEKLEPSISVLNDFYAALEVCSRNDICDSEVALQLFQENACSFLNRHRSFLIQRREESGDDSIGAGMERFAKDTRGARTVSCIKPPAKWYQWFK